jgi:hypothetical protein
MLREMMEQFLLVRLQFLCLLGAIGLHITYKVGGTHQRTTTAEEVSKGGKIKR